MNRIQRPKLDSADFLLLEARTAETYLDLAQRSFDDEVIRRSLARARRALTAMTDFLTESGADDEDIQIIGRVRDDLRDRLGAVMRLAAPAGTPSAAGQHYAKQVVSG